MSDRGETLFEPLKPPQPAVAINATDTKKSRRGFLSKFTSRDYRMRRSHGNI
jgi:hypothetical protein